jgi:hypothetical protein
MLYAATFNKSIFAILHFKNKCNEYKNVYKNTNNVCTNVINTKNGIKKKFYYWEKYPPM